MEHINQSQIDVAGNHQPACCLAFGHNAQHTIERTGFLVLKEQQHIGFCFGKRKLEGLLLLKKRDIPKPDVYLVEFCRGKYGIFFQFEHMLQIISLNFCITIYYQAVQLYKFAFVDVYICRKSRVAEINTIELCRCKNVPSFGVILHYPIAQFGKIQQVMHFLPACPKWQAVGIDRNICA